MRIVLRVIAGALAGKEFAFADHDTFLVGRSKHTHLQLPTKDRTCSRIHFMLEINPPRCRLLDMGSNNGTHVNGKRVKTTDLHDGDTIRAGTTILQVAIERPPEPTLPSIEPSQTEPVPTVTAAPPTAVPRTVADAPRPAAAPVAGAALGPAIPGYELLRKLGAGGMGVVYLARRLDDEVQVALKTILPDKAAEPREVERFLREARILRDLDHPHIVRFRDMGESNGCFYFAMDYVAGVDARQLVKREGPLAAGRAVALTCQLLEALEYAHGQRFVHRDIKPSNVLLKSADGRETVQLADFGLARVYQAAAWSGLTMSTDIGGTPAFMAPEQVVNFRAAPPSVDQYAAAATLYYLLSGAYVFDLPRAARLLYAMILNDDPVPLVERRPDIPIALANVIHRAGARPGETLSIGKWFTKGVTGFITNQLNV